jgi:hypothetical protein
LSSRPFCCCASDAPFFTTLHGLHTYRNFGLQLLTYLSTFEKGFPTHSMPNSWLVQDIELLERINHGILVLIILAQRSHSDFD